MPKKSDRAYVVQVGVVGGHEQGAVVRDEDFGGLPEGRIDQLVKSGALREATADEARIFDTQTVTSARTGGEVEDQFADQTRADALAREELIRGHEVLARDRESLAAERRAHEEQVRAFEAHRDEMIASLEARQQAQEEQAAALGAVPAAGTVPATEADTGDKKGK